MMVQGLLWKSILLKQQIIPGTGMMSQKYILLFHPEHILKFDEKIAAIRKKYEDHYRTHLDIQSFDTEIVH